MRPYFVLSTFDSFFATKNRIFSRVSSIAKNSIFGAHNNRALLLFSRHRQEP